MVADPRAAEYIRSQLDAGFTIETIERAMLDAGWKEQQVEEAIDSVTEETQARDEAGPAEPLPPGPGRPFVPPRTGPSGPPPGFPGPRHLPGQLPEQEKPPSGPQTGQKPSPPEGRGPSLVCMLGFGLALAGGAAALNEALLSVVPDLFSMAADFLSPASFATLLGDPAMAGITGVIFGLAVIAMAALMAVMRDSRIFLAPAVLALSVVLLLNGFLAGSLLGISGGALGLLRK